MTTLAILNPADLLGQELRQSLEQRPELWDELVLTATDETEVGTLTEIRGAAAMVQRLDPENLARADIAFFCGGIDEARPVLASLGSATTAIVLSPDATAADGRPVVAGIEGLRNPERGEVLLSPHPGAVMVAHLLHPLSPFSIAQAAATLLQPASQRGQAALDELLDQTRSILAFASERPQEVFGRQLAFNLFPVPPEPGVLGGLVRQALDLEAPVATQVIQGSVFHSFAASLFVKLGSDPGPEAVREALGDHGAIELVSADEPGPIDVAAGERVLVGSVEPQPGDPGTYAIWGVMDNLTRGGALNAIGIAEKVLGR